MFLFRHILQLCTIACFSVATEGHVLFAVNIEDFRNLANQFLSTNVTRTLTRLVSENVGAIRRDDTNADLVSGIDLNKIAELIRDKILLKHKTTVSSTKETRTQNINKRFNTVKNTADMTEFPKTTKRIKNIRRHPNYKTSPGLVYVKDDVETLFQSYNDQSIKYDTIKHDNSEARPSESEEEIVSQETLSKKGSMDVKENTQQQDDTNKKMDNTEAKLGEWLYNHIIAERPTKLQNHKTGNGDINDEGYSDELPDESKHIQYVYSPLEQDKIKQNIENVADLQFKKDTNNFNRQDQQTDGINNDYVMGPKKNTIYKNTPQKQPIVQNQEIENEAMAKLDYAKRILGNNNTFKQESTGSGPEKLPFEQDTINESIMGPQLSTDYKKKLQKQIIEEHQEIDNEVTDKRDSVKSIPGNKNTFNRESIGLGQDQQADEQGAINEWIMKPQINTIYKKKPQKQEIEENYMSSKTKRPRPNKGQEINIFSSEVKPEYVRVKKIPENKNKFNNKHTDLDEGVARMPADLEESNPEPIKSKIESLLFAEEGKQQPIEKHILYDKFVLGSKDKENNQKEPQRQSIRDNYKLSKEIKRVDPKQADKSDEKLIMEMKDVFNQNEEEASAHSTPDIRKTKKQGPLRHREAKSDSDKSKIKSTQDTEEVQEDSKQENNIQRKIPQKHSIEENDMHETYSSSSKAKNKKYTKPLLEDDFEKSRKESKLRHDAISDKDEEISNKKRTLKIIKGSSDTVEKQRLTKKAPMKEEKYVEDLPDFESAKLGSSSDEIKEKQVKEHDTTNKYKLGKRKETSKKQSQEEDEKYDNKYNKRPQKHSIEENDMHMTMTSSETKNKKGDRSDSKYNKYQHKETLKKQANEVDDKFDTKYKKRPQKHSIEERETHTLSSETKIKKGDKYENKYNKYQHKETSKKQSMEENKTYEKETPDRKSKEKSKFKKQPIEENSLYEIYELGSKHKSKDREVDKDDDNGHEETAVEKKNRLYDGRNKDDFNHGSNRDDFNPGRNKDDFNHGRNKDDFNHGSNKDDFNHGRNKDDFNHGRNKDDYNDGRNKDDFNHGRNKDDFNHGSNKDDFNIGRNKDDFNIGRNKDDFNHGRNKDDFNHGRNKDNYNNGRNKDDFNHGRNKDDFNYGSNKDDFNHGRNKDDFNIGSIRDDFNHVRNKDDFNHGNNKDDFNDGRNKDDYNNGRNKDDFNHSSNKDDSDNNDELLLKNKNKHILKATKNVKRPRHEENQEERPLEGYADDPRPDFKEVKPEHIKANTYRILESDERKGKPTKRFVMKGTLIPKREFYKLSSPNYYKDLPRNVDKYDFSEPIPDRDRQRDKVRYLKREPARVNRKVKLPRFERVK